MAGFIATAEQWIEFKRNWQDALQAYEVTELHIKNFAHSRKESSAWKGDEQRRARFLDRLINIIQTRVRHGFACAVMMDGYREVDRQYCLSNKFAPIGLAACACLDKVKKWASENNIDRKQICYMFEDGDKDKGSLTRSIEEHHGFVPIYLHKSDSGALQAADLLAYEHLIANRRIYKSGTGTLAFSDMRRSLQALDKIPHGKDGEHWDVYGREELELHCSANSYSLRNVAAGT